MEWSFWRGVNFAGRGGDGTRKSIVVVECDGTVGVVITHRESDNESRDLIPFWGLKLHPSYLELLSCIQYKFNGLTRNSEAWRRRLKATRETAAIASCLTTKILSVLTVV